MINNACCLSLEILLFHWSTILYCSSAANMWQHLNTHLHNWIYIYMYCVYIHIYTNMYIHISFNSGRLTVYILIFTYNIAHFVIYNTIPCSDQACALCGRRGARGLTARDPAVPAQSGVSGPVRQAATCGRDRSQPVRATGLRTPSVSSSPVQVSYFFFALSSH